MQTTSSSISTAPPTTTVAPVVTNPPMNNGVIQTDAYLWRDKLYPTVESRRRAHLQSLLEAHNIEHISKVVDILVHDIEALSFRNMTQAWKCTDGSLFTTKEKADDYQRLLNEQQLIDQMLDKRLNR